MERDVFSDALYKVIKAVLIEFIKSDRFVNALNDYGAFKENPAVRHILKSMIDEHLTEDVIKDIVLPFLSDNKESSKKELTLQKTKNQLTSQYGYNEQSVSYLMNSFHSVFGSPMESQENNAKCDKAHIKILNDEYFCINTVLSSISINNTIDDKIIVPNGVTEIGVCAFSGCYRAKEIYLPNTVVRIDNNAFDGCRELENVVLPNNLEYIGNFAFASCYKLKNIVLPNSLKHIGDSAFWCSGLTDIDIPENVKMVSGAWGCNINVHADNPHLCSIDGVVYSKDKTKLIIFPSKRNGIYSLSSSTKELAKYSIEYSNIQTLYLNQELEIINDFVFQSSKIESLYIHENIIQIGTQIMSRCEKLNNIYMMTEFSKISIDDSAFVNFTNISNCVLHVPLSQIELCQSMPCFKGFKTIVAL